MGQHTLDQSPGILAYDEAKAQWGEWWTANKAIRPEFTRQFSCIEAVMRSEFGQPWRQAEHTTRAAIHSLLDFLEIYDPSQE